MGGSPCQGFSSSGNMLNFEDGRSELFFVYVDILNHIRTLNPKVKFLLENVKMKQEWVQIITNNLGIKPVEINSALVSAQNRVRLYWFNWKVDAPKDKGIMLSDILEDGIHMNSAAIRTRPISSEGGRKSLCLEVNDSNKSLCLVTVNLNNLVTALPKGRYLDVNANNYKRRVYSVIEMCRLQTLPDDYVIGYSQNNAAKLLGNGWTVDVIVHILSNLSKEL